MALPGADQPSAAGARAQAPPAPDAAFAEALGLEPAALAAREPAPSAEVASAVPKVQAHFSLNRPGPSSFPAISLRILELVRFPDVNLNELAKNVRMDGALSAGLLALSNSAVYRGVKKIETVKDAMARLGLNEVAKLTAAISTRSLYGPEEKSEYERFGPRWDRLFLHAATVARGASELYRQRADKVAGSEQVFMAGLLHDVGKSIALRSVAALEARGKLPDLDDAGVGRVLDLVHVQVGTETHRAWQMPPQYAAATTHHHDVTVPAGENAVTVHLVRLVSALALMRSEPGQHPRAPAEAVDSARALGIPPAGLAAVAAKVEADEEWVRLLFGGSLGGART